MTQIDFYIQVADKADVACRLTAKAYRQGLKVLVRCADPAGAESFGRRLWSFAATSFIPHCAPDDPLAAETPVHVAGTSADPSLEQVLINLSGERPSYFSRFDRLMEIVGADEADRADARERWKFYKDRGYALQCHDLSTAPSPLR